MKNSKWIWFLIFVIGVGVRCSHLLQPVDTDSWREADVSSMARFFYQNGTDIFHPQIGYGGPGPGYVESEFQLYAYMIATSYKIFGFWEPTGRLISFFFGLATMLVFFKLSRFLLNERAAILASLFFALSPILMVISIAIQSEATMFFFYVSAAYAFVRWLDKPAAKYYILTIICTALALLCKATAANLGILFVALLLYKKNWKFLFRPNVLVLGACCIIPAVAWYMYGYQFYVKYGNSLGLSNENPWVGWDFLTSKHLSLSLLKVELAYVWSATGPLIVILALLFTKVIKRHDFRLGLFWFASVVLFYIIAARTTAEEWAWYYHIFSIPSVAILIGCSVAELFDTYQPQINIFSKAVVNKMAILKSRAIIGLLVLFVGVFLLHAFSYLTTTKQSKLTANARFTKQALYTTSPFYACTDSLKKLIPPDALFLANGGRKADDLGYSLAVEIGYFFYWLDRKGYCISTKEQSIENLQAFKQKGVTYYLGEVRIMQQQPGFEEAVRKHYTPIFECNGCILIKL
jgi:hypothetical protein